MQIGTKTVQSMQIGNKTVQNIITSDGSYLYDRGEIDIIDVSVLADRTFVMVQVTIEGQPLSNQPVSLRYTRGGSFVSTATQTTSAGTGTTEFTLFDEPTIIIAYTTINGNEISKQWRSSS